MKDRESLLKSQLTVFGINYPDSRELAQLNKVNVACVYRLRLRFRVLIRLLDAFLFAKDVAVIELVWQLTDEWNDAWERYKTGNFWTIELEEMDTTANLLHRKFTKLSKELRERNWDIVEHTRCDLVVIQFRTRGKYVPFPCIFHEAQSSVCQPSFSRMSIYREN